MSMHAKENNSNLLYMQGPNNDELHSTFSLSKHAYIPFVDGLYLQ